jgi:hypothetical protein
MYKMEEELKKELEQRRWMLKIEPWIERQESISYQYMVLLELLLSRRKIIYRKCNIPNLLFHALKSTENYKAYLNYLEMTERIKLFVSALPKTEYDSYARYKIPDIRLIIAAEEECISIKETTLIYLDNIDYSFQNVMNTSQEMTAVSSS